MSERTAELIQEVLGLKLVERIELADCLEASIAIELPGVADSPVSAESLEEEEYRLLIERVAEADKHPEQVIDGERAMREIEEYARTKKRP